MERKELEETVKQDLETRVREGVKALLEQILEEELTVHLGATPYQRSPTRKGRRNGEYERDLVTGVGQIQQLRVPRDREGTFQTELFERYRWLTGSVEEAVLEMYLQGVSKAEVAADLRAIFAVRRRETAEALAEQFSGRWKAEFSEAVEVFENGIIEALTYLDFPSGHQGRIRTTNGLERLFQEIKRRTRVVGVFPNEQSLVVLTTTVGIRVTEEWALRRYLDMSLLEAHRQIQSGASQITQLSRH